MKSGVMPVTCIALATANHSQAWPIASLKPVGLPPESVAQAGDKLQAAPIGVENALNARQARCNPPPGWHAAGLQRFPA